MKKTDKIKDIPFGYYCYHGGRGDVSYRACPFYKHKLSNSGLNFKKQNQGYCKLLHTFLSIDDQVKDCKINKGE